MERDDGPGVRRVLYATALLAAIFLTSFLGIQPPRSVSAEAPADRFSADRALGVLSTLMGGDTPHPIGSDANAEVRNRILAEFTKLGYSPRTQSAFDCDGYGVCATVQNVLARLDGAQPGPAVLLAAHYDSVPAGPGGSDDGVGVAAVLETARALKSLPAPLHAVIFLIDDGEEAGLLGARAFVDFHPWASEVRAAVNVDARGTSGPSLMFETGSANDWVVRLYARSVARPATSSIAYTIYKQLPNDTDFSVFKSAGFQGLNFALIGNAPVYHTPLDNLQNVNPASLQHQGDNALQAIRALANSDLSNPSESDAVFFDAFGHWTIHWAARWTLLFAALATLLIAVQIAFLLWSGRVSGNQFLWGLVAWFMQIISLTIFAYLLQRLLLLTGGVQANWVAHPIPLESVFWMLPVAIIVIHGIVIAHRAGLWGLWSGIWAWWALLSMVCAWKSPGVSYVLLVPLTAAGLAVLPFTLTRIPKFVAESSDASGAPAIEEHSKLASFAVLLPLGVSAIIGFGPALLIYSALGGWAIVGLAMLIGLILTPISPLCADLRDLRGLRAAAIPGVSVAAIALAAFGAVVVPAYSAKSPEHVNIEYWQDSDAGLAQWIVESDSGRLPNALRLAAPFSRMGIGPFPWDGGIKFLAGAPHLSLASPTFTILDDSQTGSRSFYHALLRSERAAPVAMLLFPPGSHAEDVRVGGVPATPQTKTGRSMLNGWSMYACFAMPEQGVEISFSLPVGKPIDISAMDETYGLPLEGQFLLKARPQTASPANAGDITIVTRRVRFFP